MDELSISYNMLLAENHDLQASNNRLRKLLEDVAIWYEADEFEYMPKRLWKRIKKELKEKK